MPMIDYPRLYGWVAAHPRLLSVMRAAHIPSVIFVVLSYAVHLLVCTWLGSLERGLTLVAVSAAPFLAVSIMRLIANEKRPYEVYDLEAAGLAKPRDKGGRSFPSRHAMSAFLVGTLLFADAPILGAVVLLIGVYIAVYRELVGMHFVSDVLVGSLLGVATGTLGALCLYFFC